MSTLLEICIDSIESAFAAKRGGADRLEVCSSLAVGGTTPSYGLVKQCVHDVQLPVMMMIRPHDGGFNYSAPDLEVMLADIEIARSIGVQGVVFGATTEANAIDHEHCCTLLEAAQTMETTFHRAFDTLADPLAGFEQLKELGFDRLLTSGQAATAEEGVPLIHKLNAHTDSRITVLAGAGINPQNASRIQADTGVRELHASASHAVNPQPTGKVAYGTDRRITSEELVRSIKKSLT